MHHNDCENTMHHCTYRQVRGQCLRKKQIDRSHTISKHSHTGRKILENALRARNHREAIVHCDHDGEESKNHTRGNVRNTIRNPIHTYVDYDNQKLYRYCDQSLPKSLTHESRNYAPWRARGSRASVHLHFHNVTRKCRISLFVYNNVGYPYKEIDTELLQTTK